MNYIILILLILVGIYDLFLVFTKKPTVSQRYQKLFPPACDCFVFGMGIFVICLFHAADPKMIDFTLWVIIAALLGHICLPAKETYKK